jgi:hypothetical protein
VVRADIDVEPGGALAPEQLVQHHIFAVLAEVDPQATLVDELKDSRQFHERGGCTGRD